MNINTKNDGLKMYNKALELALEELLEKAFDQVSYRPQFLKQLLDSYIYILGISEDNVGDHIEHTLTEGSKVQIKSWNKEDGTEILPFFTSLEKLQKAIQYEENYLRIHTRSFFELTLGANLVLNPNSNVTKEFLAAEIAGLLNEDFDLPSQSSQNNINVSMSHPSPYPINMVEQIKILLQIKPSVSSAYLVQIHDVEKDSKPSLALGLLLSQALTEQEKQQLSRQVGQTAHDSLLQKKPIDLIFIDMNDKKGLSHYFLHETQPFYIRQDEKKKGIFAKLFA